MPSPEYIVVEDNRLPLDDILSETKTCPYSLCNLKSVCLLRSQLDLALNVGEMGPYFNNSVIRAIRKNPGYRECPTFPGQLGRYPEILPNEANFLKRYYSIPPKDMDIATLDDIMEERSF